jgi:hypothetical protein
VLEKKCIQDIGEKARKKKTTGNVKPRWVNNIEMYIIRIELDDKG